MHRVFKTSILAAAAIIPSAAMMLSASAIGGNMVTNPNFDTNLAGWAPSASPQATLQYGFEHTLVVKNIDTADTATQASAMQCADKVLGGESYDFSVGTAIPQGQHRTGGSQARAFFFATNDCTGAILSSPQTMQITSRAVGRTSPRPSSPRLAPTPSAFTSCPRNTRLKRAS